VLAGTHAERRAVHPLLPLLFQVRHQAQLQLGLLPQLGITALTPPPLPNVCVVQWCPEANRSDVVDGTVLLESIEKEKVTCSLEKPWSFHHKTITQETVIYCFERKGNCYLWGQIIGE
jgi:hypothetical protein